MAFAEEENERVSWWDITEIFFPSASVHCLLVRRRWLPPLDGSPPSAVPLSSRPNDSQGSSLRCHLSIYLDYCKSELREIGALSDGLRMECVRQVIPPRWLRRVPTNLPPSQSQRGRPFLSILSRRAPPIKSLEKECLEDEEDEVEEEEEAVTMQLGRMTRLRKGEGITQRVLLRSFEAGGQCGKQTRMPK